MNRNSKLQIFLNGLLYENPLLTGAIGICSALSMTAKASDALSAAIMVVFTLVLTNSLLSALKRVIPDQVRIPCCMLLIATVVTLESLITGAYMPGIRDSLQDYIPMIAVNCLILGRGEIFALKNSITNSITDAFGSGLGYGAALLITAMLREVLGSGSLFGMYVFPEGFAPVTLFIMIPGGLFTLGILSALLKKLLSLGKAESQHEKCLACPAAAHCPRNGKGGCTR